MPTHAAFLKGMNLGNRRLTNQELRGHFEAIGLTEVSTFRASGNVIFSSPQKRSERALVELIEADLAKLLGYPVVTFVRDGAGLIEIAGAEPFGAAVSSKLKGKHQVMLLGTKPKTAARREALALAGSDDALVVQGRELHWLPSGGMSDSQLDLKALDRLLGPMTIRTKGTVEQIVSRHFAA